MMLLYDLYVVTQMIIIMIVMVGHPCYGTCDFEYCLYIIPYRLSLIYGSIWLFAGSFTTNKHFLASARAWPNQNFTPYLKKID